VERQLQRAVYVCFTNTIKNRDGGTHLTGFRQALTRTINNYATEFKLLKEMKGGTLSGDDLREGLTAVISVKHARPQVLEPDQGQAGLVRGRGRGQRSSASGSASTSSAPQGGAQAIIAKASLAARAREAARKAREMVQRKGALE
jgi:DNA gyrase subunit B